jgi:hypothetical protein
MFLCRVIGWDGGHSIPDLGHDYNFTAIFINPLRPKFFPSRQSIKSPKQLPPLFTETAGTLLSS